jgi:hypothetical protein
MEKADQQRITENLTLKEIIDRTRSELDKSKKNVALLEDKLDQKE